MSRKAVVSLLVITVIFCSISLGVTGILKAQIKEIKDSTGTADISAQLQQIIQNQQAILSKLNDMKEELRIIKVRTSIRGTSS